MPDIDNINHVGIAVRDLPAVVARYEAMGFQLTPFSAHAGAWKPGQAVQSFAAGNRCVMFANTYLEILASENPEAPAPRIQNFLRRHQGGHIICFNSEDIAAVDRRLTAADVQTSGVIPLQRQIETPDGVRTAKFERVQFAPEDSPEGYIQAAKHLTPEYIYQPRYIQHRNGCDALSDTIVVADDVAHFAEKYARYLGTGPQQHERDHAQFDLPLGTRLLILSTARARDLLPGTLTPLPPCIAAVAFRTPDVTAQSARLRSAKIPFTETEERLIVPAEEAGGIAIIFQPLH